MLQAFLSFLLLYKYTALFLITFFASFILPLPASATLVAAGAFAAQGYLDPFYVCAISFTGSILGDSLAFFISYKWGGTLLMKIGFKKILQSKKFKSLEYYFLEHSFSTIFYSRFLITNLGVPINILAGLSKTSFKKFIFFGYIGELTYVLMYVGIGYATDGAWQYMSNILQNVAILLLLIIFVILLKKFYFTKKYPLN